jgi:hypothetical protein
MADTAYGTGKFLNFVVDADIAPYIPVWDKSTRDDGTFSRADFAFDKERNVYTARGLWPIGPNQGQLGLILEPGGAGLRLRRPTKVRVCDPL